MENCKKQNSKHSTVEENTPVKINDSIINNQEVMADFLSTSSWF
jgi:hypothetical protein